MMRQEMNNCREMTQRAMGLPLWKRMLDLMVMLLSFPALVLVGIGVALLIKCGSSGPVIFRQRRVGYLGQEFICYKFRTMGVDAETVSHQGHTHRLMRAQIPMVKLDARMDPRLVPFGAALRATGLDELPQLINVLRGEMSIVGPRPCVLYEYELYEPEHRRRFEAVPGLTGLWQVSGKNGTTFNEMVRLDVEYAQRKSLSLDLKIILKTFPVLWTQWCEIRALRSKEAAASMARVGKSVESYRL